MCVQRSVMMITAGETTSVTSHSSRFSNTCRDKYELNAIKCHPMNNSFVCRRLHCILSSIDLDNPPDLSTQLQPFRILSIGFNIEIC